MARTNKTRFAVLGMLSLQPASGYEIKRMMQQSTNNFWREGDSSIYPILKQLLEEEMVSVEIANEDTDKPKKVYSITGDGQAELQDWLSEEPEEFHARNELLLKVFFGWNVDKSIIINHIKKLKQHTIEKQQILQDVADRYFSGKLSKDKLYRFLSLKYGMIHVAANLTWCDDVVGLLNET